MGNCIGRDSLRIPQKTLQKMPGYLSNPEIIILHLIYSDLSERVEANKINLENFLLFFHKNGYWGEQLFQQFDCDQTNLISEEQFIRGISKIFKSSQNEKISLLFKFFSHGGHGSSGGICFHDFLTMLYNYPKQDLIQILNDKQFIEKYLKNHLHPVGQNAEEGGAYYSLQSSTNIRQYLPPSLDNLTERLTRKFSQTSRFTDKTDEQFPSLLGRELAKTVQHKRKMSDSLIRLSYDNQVLNIRAMNIQQLVKIFALMVFREARIDIKSGKLKFDEFERWVSEHKTLYKNYYYGFHNQIWEVDSSTNKPKYLTMACEKSSEAKTCIKGKSVSIKLYFHNSILVACRTDRLEEPLLVICLEGLAVRPIFQIQHGFGIEVSHRDGLYQDKTFFFKNQQLLLQWMFFLQYYKGYTVQTRYEVQQKIGRGKFSIVYRCVALEDGQEFALKEIATYKLEQEAKLLIAQVLAYLSHESSIMQVVSHPFLLQFRECIQTKTHLYIITELVKGIDLFALVKNRERLKEKEAAKICQQIIVGVRFLHSLDIVHRDLKPENIMVILDESQEIENIKIIDFGFSNYLSKIHASKGDFDMAGTPNYIAPEVLKQQPFGFKIDNFAIGVILFFMLMGTLPFYNLDITKTLANTMNGSFSFGDRVVISPQAKDLVESLLKNDPTQRISLDRALEHDWFQILAYPH